MAYSLEQRTNLVLWSVGGLSREQAGVIAQMCQDAEQRGENSAVWHQSALYLGNKCNCVKCSPNAPKGRFAFKSI